MVKIPSGSTRRATPRQLRFIRNLSRERGSQLSREHLQRLTDMLTHPVSFDKADATIKWLLRNTQRPVPQSEKAQWSDEDQSLMHDRSGDPDYSERRRGKVPAPIGVYVKDGEVYLVRASKQHPERRLAVRLVEAPPRMTENGEKATFDHVRALGMVYELTEADRMSDADLHDYMIRHAQCVNCRKHIYAERTLRKGVTPMGLMGRTCARRLGYLPPVKHRTPRVAA